MNTHMLLIRKAVGKYPFGISWAGITEILEQVKSFFKET
jgi:hypothetical protein